MSYRPACTLGWNYISKKCLCILQYGILLQLMCAGVIFKFYMHELIELLSFCRSYYIKASSFRVKGEQPESIISAIIETVLFISQMWNNYFLIILYVKLCISWCWKYQRSGSLSSRAFKSAHGDSWDEAYPGKALIHNSRH